MIRMFTNFFRNHPNIRWALTAYAMSYICWLPLLVIGRIINLKIVGAIIAILTLLEFFINVVLCIQARQFEKKNGEPNAYMRLVYSILGVISEFTAHPIITIQKSIADIKNAESSEKIKKIVLLVASIAFLFIAATAVISIILALIVALFAMSYGGGAGTRICPHCGAYVGFGDEYCPDCGGALF